MLSYRNYEKPRLCSIIQIKTQIRVEKTSCGAHARSYFQCRASEMLTNPTTWQFEFQTSHFQYYTILLIYC